MDTPSCFVGYPWKCRRPRRSRSRRRICVADEVRVRTDGRCSRFHVRRFVEALTLGQKIVPPFSEASTLSAPSEARSSLSALYGESGVAAASPVEVVDEAVLSGRTPTTKQARHRRDSSGRGGF